MQSLVDASQLSALLSSTYDAEAQWRQQQQQQQQQRGEIGGGVVNPSSNNHTRMQPILRHTSIINVNNNKSRQHQHKLAFQQESKESFIVPPQQPQQQQQQQKISILSLLERPLSMNTAASVGGGTKGGGMMAFERPASLPSTSSILYSLAAPTSTTKRGGYQPNQQHPMTSTPPPPVLLSRLSNYSSSPAATAAGGGTSFSSTSPGHTNLLPRPPSPPPPELRRFLSAAPRPSAPATTVGSSESGIVISSNNSNGSSSARSHNSNTIYITPTQHSANHHHLNSKSSAGGGSPDSSSSPSPPSHTRSPQSSPPLRNRLLEARMLNQMNASGNGTAGAGVKLIEPSLRIIEPLYSSSSPSSATSSSAPVTAAARPFSSTSPYSASPTTDTIPLTPLWSRIFENADREASLESVSTTTPAHDSPIHILQSASSSSSTTRSDPFSRMFVPPSAASLAPTAANSIHASAAQSKVVSPSVSRPRSPPHIQQQQNPFSKMFVPPSAASLAPTAANSIHASPSQSRPRSPPLTVVAQQQQPNLLSSSDDDFSPAISRTLNLNASSPPIEAQMIASLLANGSPVQSTSTSTSNSSVSSRINSPPGSSRTLTVGRTRSSNPGGSSHAQSTLRTASLPSTSTAATTSTSQPPSTTTSTSAATTITSPRATKVLIASLVEKANVQLKQQTSPSGAAQQQQQSTTAALPSLNNSAATPSSPSSTLAPAPAFRLRSPSFTPRVPRTPQITLLLSQAQAATGNGETFTVANVGQIVDPPPRPVRQRHQQEEDEDGENFVVSLNSPAHAAAASSTTSSSFTTPQPGKRDLHLNPNPQDYTARLSKQKRGSTSHHAAAVLASGHMPTQEEIEQAQMYLMRMGALSPKSANLLAQSGGNVNLSAKTSVSGGSTGQPFSFTPNNYNNYSNTVTPVQPSPLQSPTFQSSPSSFSPSFSPPFSPALSPSFSPVFGVTGISSGVIIPPLPGTTDASSTIVSPLPSPLPPRMTTTIRVERYDLRPHTNTVKLTRMQEARMKAEQHVIEEGKIQAEDRERRKREMEMKKQRQTERKEEKERRKREKEVKEEEERLRKQQQEEEEEMNRLNIDPDLDPSTDLNTNILSDGDLDADLSILSDNDDPIQQTEAHSIQRARQMNAAIMSNVNSPKNESRSLKDGGSDEKRSHEDTNKHDGKNQDNSAARAKSSERGHRSIPSSSNATQSRPSSSPHVNPSSTSSTSQHPLPQHKRTHTRQQSSLMAKFGFSVGALHNTNIGAAGGGVATTGVVVNTNTQQSQYEDVFGAWRMNLRQMRVGNTVGSTDPKHRSTISTSSNPSSSLNHHIATPFTANLPTDNNGCHHPLMSPDHPNFLSHLNPRSSNYNAHVNPGSVNYNNNEQSSDPQHQIYTNPHSLTYNIFYHTFSRYYGLGQVVMDKYLKKYERLIGVGGNAVTDTLSIYHPLNPLWTPYLPELMKDREKQALKNKGRVGGAVNTVAASTANVTAGHSSLPTSPLQSHRALHPAHQQPSTTSNNNNANKKPFVSPFAHLPPAQLARLRDEALRYTLGIGSEDSRTDSSSASIKWSDLFRATLQETLGSSMWKLAEEMFNRGKSPPPMNGESSSDTQSSEDPYFGLSLTAYSLRAHMSLFCDPSMLTDSDGNDLFNASDASYTHESQAVPVFPFPPRRFFLREEMRKYEAELREQLKIEHDARVSEYTDLVELAKRQWATEMALANGPSKRTRQISIVSKQPQLQTVPALNPKGS